MQTKCDIAACTMLQLLRGNRISSVLKGENIIQEVDVLSLPFKITLVSYKSHIWPHISLTSSLILTFFFNLTFGLTISLHLASLTFFFSLTFGFTSNFTFGFTFGQTFSLTYGYTFSLTYIFIQLHDFIIQLLDSLTSSLAWSLTYLYLASYSASHSA